MTYSQLEEMSQTSSRRSRNIKEKRESSTPNRIQSTQSADQIDELVDGYLGEYDNSETDSYVINDEISLEENKISQAKTPNSHHAEVKLKTNFHKRKLSFFGQKFDSHHTKLSSKTSKTGEENLTRTTDNSPSPSDNCVWCYKVFDKIWGRFRLTEKTKKNSKITNVAALTPEETEEKVSSILASIRRNNLIALRTAAKNGNLEEIRRLHMLGVPLDVPTKFGVSLLHFAALEGQDLTVRMLIDEFGLDSNCASNDGVSPLHGAASRGHNAAVRALMELGANANSRDSSNGTPLHDAASRGQNGAIVIMVAIGADVNVMCKNGLTPLLCAVRRGFLTTVRILAQLGAEVNGMDTIGVKAPVQVAAESRHKSIVLLLSEIGAYTGVAI